MTPDEGSRSSVGRVNALRDIGRWDEALSEASRLVASDPTPGHLLLLSECARNAGQPDLARSAAERAVAGAPDDADARMAVAFASRGRSGLKMARKAVALEPDGWTHHVNTASIAVAVGRPLLAARYNRRGIELAPAQPDVWRVAARVQSSLGDPARAKRSLERSLSLQPGQPAVLADLAYLLARDGHVDEAVRLHSSAISAAPARSDLLLLAGRSANRRTLFPVAVVLGFLLGFSGGSIIGGLIVAWLAGVAVNWIDGRRVRVGRSPLFMAKRLAAQPGLGSAVVAYRREALKRRQVGPLMGTPLWRYMAYAAVLAVVGVLFATEHLAVGLLVLATAAIPGGIGWTRMNRSRWLDAG